MTIGDRIKLLRKQRKMSMEDVAFGLNVGRATVCRYENGQITNIPSDKIEQMATLFSVAPAYLMGWEEHEIEDETPKTKEAKMLSKGIDRLPKVQREKALAMFKVMFEPQFADLFTKENEDET